MKQYKNKFFNKIGYEKSATENLFYGSLRNDKRNKIWKKQRKKWGNYDSRVGWCLCTYMAEQIYTWLKIYLKEADKFVDLTYTKFNIEGKEITQKEAIISIIDDLEFWLLNQDKCDETILDECSKRSKRAYEWLGIILPSLWW